MTSKFRHPYLEVALEFNRSQDERRAAGQVPGVALESISNDSSCSWWPENCQGNVTEEPDSQEMVETDNMIDVEMRNEEPLHSLKVPDFETLESARIEQQREREIRW